MIEYTISNYVDNNDKEPIKDWLKSLDGTTRKRILLRFDRLKDGNFGDYRQLDEYNIIVLLINGGDKKSQVKDIKTAKEIITKLKGI